MIAMKKTFLIFTVTSVIFAAYSLMAYSQPGWHPGGYGMGPGMMGGYGYGRMEPYGWVEIPSKLPAPTNSQWVQKLGEILSMEKDSLAQYQADQEKFNAYMPYMMVIPQEELHIQWIERLFAAYGIKPSIKTGSVVEAKTLTDAYELGVKTERALLPIYEWLVKNAQDKQTAGILDTALIQSRIHLTMFDHALRVGHRYGFGMNRWFGRGYPMGPGMMEAYPYGPGHGMMGWYGYGGGPQKYYGNRPIDINEAHAVIDDYLRQTRNPHLKAGKIKDIGNAFEAEILTKENSMVDKIIIDKDTGWMRSAY